MDRPRLLFISLGAMAVVLCVSVIFLTVFRQNHSPVPQTRTIIINSAPPRPASPQAAQDVARATPAPVVLPEKEIPKQQEPPPEPVSFRIKRSKAFEKVGPIRLRLLKASAKWNTCDLYINSSGSSYQKQARLNKPVQIDLGNNGGSAELLVTTIKADQISGSIQQK